MKNRKDQFADFRSFEENFNENDRLGVRTLRLQTLEDFCKASFTNVYQMPVFGSCRTLTRLVQFKFFLCMKQEGRSSTQIFKRRFKLNIIRWKKRSDHLLNDLRLMKNQCIKRTAESKGLMN